MQNEQQAAKPLERRIDMAVPMADIEKGVEQRLRKMARTVKMAGFRPGKVPFKMVQQHYGAQARSEVIGEAVEKAFGDAVREQNLRVAGYPRIEPRGGEDAAALQFSAVFEVYPEIRLNGVAESLLHRLADGLAARLGAILLLHHLERHLAGAEARHLHGARHLLQALLDISIDIGRLQRHVYAALQGICGLLVGLHEKS